MRWRAVVALQSPRIVAQVNEFDSKADLIEAALASAHVPFALDGKPFLRFRGRLCWDGSFPDFIYFDNSNFIKRDGQVRGE